MECLKRWGTIHIDGVGSLSLVYKSLPEERVHVSFSPSETLVDYLNGDKNGEECSPR